MKLKGETSYFASDRLKNDQEKLFQLTLVGTIFAHSKKLIARNIEMKQSQEVISGLERLHENMSRCDLDA